MVSRNESFDNYHITKQEKRQKHLRKALTIIGTGRYKNITNLATAAARLVTELEIKDSKEGDVLEPCSYTTLTRNKKYYRPVLDAYLDGSSGLETSNVTGGIPFEEHEALKVHCAHLDHENTMIKDRLANTEHSGKESKLLSNINVLERSEDIEFLVGVINTVVSSFTELVDSIEPSQIDDEYQYAGLHGPEGLILTWDEMLRFKGLSDEVSR